MRPLYSSTFLARDPLSVISRLSLTLSRDQWKGHTLLFSLSANFPPNNLQDIVGELQAYGKANEKGEGKGRVVGSITAPLSSVTFPKQKQKSFHSNERDEYLSCAVAIFDTAHCVPFYSTLPGRPEVQVGRWHSFRKQEDSSADMGVEAMKDMPPGETNWEELWSRAASKKGELLPKELHSIHSKDIHSLLYMSVPHPDLLTQAFSSHLPTTRTMGLVATPTHFLTGRPVTLFLDDRIYGGGAVGLALLSNNTAAEDLPQLKTQFFGVEKLSKPMKVTSTEGNMVNSLDGLNPTQLLLRAIADAGISASLDTNVTRTFTEDQEFGLGVTWPGQGTRIYKITAGDPAHRGGSISLDAVRAPSDGTMVQFLHRTRNTPLKLDISEPPKSNKSKQTIAFLTVPELAATGSSSDTSYLHLRDTFLAGSSSGLTVSDIGRFNEVWSSSFSGGMASLAWKHKSNSKKLLTSTVLGD